MSAELSVIREDERLIDEVQYDATTNYTEPGEDIKQQPIKVNKWDVIPSLWCGAFLAALDSTIVTAIYPMIGSDFQKSDQAVWVATAYMLASSAFQPLYGGLSDIFGRKPVLLFSNIVFLIGSLGCSLSQTMTQLLVARVIAGIGGAGLGTLSSIIVSDLVTLKERSTYNGFANLVYGVGQVVGAPLGGYLADKFGWRYAFLIQCPITFLSIIIINFRVKLYSSSVKVRFRDIDFFGSFFLISAVVLALITLQELSSAVDISYKPLLTISASLICFAAVYIIESKVKNPIILLKVLLSRNPLLSGLTNFFGYMGFFAISFNLPLFLQVVHGESASKSGSRLISGVITMCVGSMVAGIVTRRTGNYYWVCIAGVTSELIGAILLTTFLEHTEGWKFQLFLCPSGLGHGLVLSATLMAIISSVNKSDQAKAISMSYLFRVLGSTMGVTASSLFINYFLTIRLKSELKDVPNHMEIIYKITKSVKEIEYLPPKLRAVVILEMATVIHKSYISVIFMEVISMSFAFFLRQYSLDR